MTPTGSEKRCKTKGYGPFRADLIHWIKSGRPAPQAGNPATRPFATTNGDTSAATASRSCSADRRTGGASPPATTDARRSPCPPLRSPQRSSSGSEQERVLTRVILQFPLWWHGPPAILKGWFDRTFPSGGVYTSRMRYDDGFFKGKQAVLSVTAG